jgi:hypothetical protein
MQVAAKIREGGRGAPKGYPTGSSPKNQLAAPHAIS